MILAFKNQPLEIWKDNVQLRDGYAKVTCESDLPIYDVQDDRFRFFPTATEDYSITIRGAGYEKTSTIRVIEPMTGGEAGKSLAIIGDSGAGAGDGIGFPKITKDYLGSPLTLLGTRGTAPYKHDGDPGASYEIWRHTYPRSVLLSAADTIDVAGYYTAIGGTPDAWLWTCGTNKVGNSTFELLDATIDAEHDDLEDLIAAIKAVTPASKHLIATAWPGNMRNQCWLDVYGYPRWDGKRRLHRYAEKTDTRFSGRTDEGIHVVRTSIQIDTYNGYPAEDPYHFVGLITGGHGQAARAIAPAVKYALWP